MPSTLPVFTLLELRLSPLLLMAAQLVSSSSTKMVGGDSMAPPACGGGPGLLCCLRGLRPSCLERGGTVAHLLRIVLSYGGRRLVAYRQPELPIGNCIRTLRNRACASLACERLVIPAGRCAWLGACKRPGARSFSGSRAMAG